MARIYEIKMMTADRKLADVMAKTDLKNMFHGWAALNGRNGKYLLLLFTFFL
jgi:hypothetical protein